MFTRRAMLRALGVGAPAAAIAAASLPKAAPPVGPAGAVRTSLVFEAEQIVFWPGRAAIPPINVATLSAISSNMGTIIAGRILPPRLYVDGEPVSTGPTRPYGCAGGPAMPVEA